MRCGWELGGRGIYLPVLAVLAVSPVSPEMVPLLRVRRRC